MKKLSLILLTLLTTLSLAACQEDEELDNVVYVTTYALEYLVDEIGKDVVNVKYVPGAQVHGESYDWSAQEIINMQDADLLFYVGGGLDTYIDASINAIFTNQNVTLTKISDSIELLEICLVHDHDQDEHDHDDEEDNYDEECENAENMPDPHFWLDVNKMLEAADIVRNQLLEHYPEKEAIINNNYVVVNLVLNKLNQDFHDALHDQHKPVITNVKLFSYYQEAYHVHLHPLTLDAHSHEDESVPTNLIEFVHLALDNNINYILFEKNATSPAGETLLTEIAKENPDIEKLYLHPLGNLTTEELAQNKNYVNIMYDNLTALKRAVE